VPEYDLNESVPRATVPGLIMASSFFFIFLARSRVAASILALSTPDREQFGPRGMALVLSLASGDCGSPDISVQVDDLSGSGLGLC
jgi:hypothetical protein